MIGVNSSSHPHQDRWLIAKIFELHEVGLVDVAKLVVNDLEYFLDYSVSGYQLQLIIDELKQRTPDLFI